MVKWIGYFFPFIGIIFSGIGFLTTDYMVMLLGILWLYIGLFSYSFSKKYMLSSTLFLGSFGLFMFGRQIARINEGVYLLNKFEHSIVYHTYVSLFITMIFFYLGLIISKKVSIKISKNKKHNYKFDVNEKALLGISQICFWGTIPFRIVLIYYYIQTAVMTGYSSIYLNGSSGAPGYIDAFSRAHLSAMIVCLVSFPKKKTCYLVSITELLIASLYLIAGKRIEFLQIVILVFFVVWLRDIFSIDEKKILNKKKVIICLMLGVALIILLQYVGTNRFRHTTEMTGIYDTVFSFLDAQGYSVEIIPLGMKHINDFPGHKQMYFWGTLWNWLKSFTGIGTVYSGQTIENAIYGYNYGGTLTWLESSYNYLVSGGGLGGSYIAELYHAYGYTGIALFNILLGYIINKLNVKKSDSILKRYFKVFMLIEIILLPRFSCWHWIGDIISKLNILFWAVIWVLSKQIINREHRQMIRGNNGI